MANVFDQFDQQQSGNVFDQFDAAPEAVVTPETDIQETDLPVQPETTLDPETLSWKDTLISGMKNLPSSGFQLLKDLKNSVVNYEDTVTALAGTIVGGIEKVIPGEQPNEKYVDLLMDFYKDRYGSIDGFKQALATDPAGVLADGASFAVPGGAMLKSVGSATKVNALTRMGSAAIKTGTAIDPFNLGQKALKVPAGLITNKLPTKLYQSAVKFSPAMGKIKVDNMIETALMNQIMPTTGGLTRLKSKLNVLNKEISDKINIAEKQGKRIHMNEFFKDMDSLRNEAIYSSDVKKINKVVEDFIQKQAIEPRRLTMSPSEAQTLKKKMYKELESTYSKIAAKPISVETKRTIVRGIKESLEQIIPEIKQLNQKNSTLIELNKAIEKRVGAINNADIIPFSSTMKAAAATQAAGGAGLIAGLTGGLISGPKIKSRIAILLKHLDKKGVKITPTKTAIEMGLVLPERIQGDNNE
jgi:hypothetical protein